MTTIVLSVEVVDMAQDEFIVLRKPNEAVCVSSQGNNFASEIGLLRNNTEFMELLRKLSREEVEVSLEELRQELGA